MTTALLEMTRLGLIGPRQLKEIESMTKTTTITPEVGKVYQTRRAGMVRNVKVLEVKEPYRHPTFGWGNNRHWVCLDLTTRRTVTMKSKENFIREVVG